MASAAKKLARKSAVKGARKLMLQHLEQAESGVERLPHRDDAEALHDLRVALRHVRTYLTTYRKLFAKAVPAKSFDALRELAHLTNPARDAEVEVSWIAGHSRARRATSGAAHLRAQLTRRHTQLLREIRERFAQDFPPLASRLRQQLERAEDTHRRTFGQSTAKQVRRQGRRLRKRLDRIQGPTDVENCHQARIAAKRVRYLLEPFSELRGAPKLIDHLKELQDTLGEMHDLHVLLKTMAEAPERARASRSRVPRSELASLAATARRQLPRLYAQVEQRWFGRAGAKLDRALGRMASTVREKGHPNK
ncbi:MAG: CHAD domain-containing protein [Hyalangium sp.]|uniref:CHAD domain-containing protein n=1 Tax=Hyalangium sp. TaxID=2028555 RepID=UPI00389A6E55